MGDLVQRGNGVEVEATELLIGHHSIRVIIGQILPPDFLLAMNEAGWLAFQRGEQPAECDAAVIRMDAHLDQQGDA